MIAYLSGKLIEKEPNFIIIDVGGIGYGAVISLSTYYELGDINSAVSLRIYTYVREDTLQLFGFISANERTLFLKLITVSGIGPKLAVTMLSGMNASEIIRAIRQNNLASLTSIPGIGKKTAERLVIELRDKLAGIPVENDSNEQGADMPTNILDNDIYEDALSALVNLGYQQKSAKIALNKAVQNGTELKVQKLLRAGLQILSKN